MSITIMGILAFGFEIGDNENSPIVDLCKDTDYDFDEFILREANFPKWKGGMTEEQYDKWVNDRQDIIELCPIEITYSGSIENVQTIITIRNAVKIAEDDIEEIEQEFFNVSPERIAAAKEWCEKYNIPWQEPKWLLSNFYG